MHEVTREVNQRRGLVVTAIAQRRGILYADGTYVTIIINAKRRERGDADLKMRKCELNPV